MATVSPPQTLDSWQGRRIPALLCAVAFLDFVDASITHGRCDAAECHGHGPDWQEFRHRLTIGGQPASARQRSEHRRGARLARVMHGERLSTAHFVVAFVGGDRAVEPGALPVGSR